MATENQNGEENDYEEYDVFKQMHIQHYKLMKLLDDKIAELMQSSNTTENGKLLLQCTTIRGKLIR